MPKLSTLTLAVSALLVSASPAFATPSATAEHEVSAGRARIVLVGSLADDRRLALLLEELLGHRGIRTDLTSAERFDPDALFGTATNGETLLFVSLGRIG